jgi:oligoendopeptidase F
VRLFDPASHRVELCESDKCDHTGFSVGFAGSTSALFYGSYDGTTNRIRAVAHEAGHAVHREFMNENQPIAAYNSGPNFVSESFAIFNEFLLLDHLYRTAVTPAEKAYYLHRFLDDATFQVYGSAKETDLEQSIYAGVENGSVRNAADLDALTQKIFSEYVPAPALSPEMKVYWARNRLFFTDPLYDVNYLFAGLLALNYFEQFEADRQGFSQRYVALLKNGFSDTPRALERRFLNIDLDDADGLVSSAATFIDQRRSILERLYQEAEQAK